MLVQTTSTSFLSFPSQIHYPLYASQKVDLLTEQIVKTKDAALAVYESFETGAAQRMWEAQRPESCCTSVGQCADCLANWVMGFFGWENYFSEPKTNARDLLAIDEEENQQVVNCSARSLYSADMNTSFVAQKNSDGSCSYEDPVKYYVFIQRANPPLNEPIDENLLCRLDECVRDYFIGCYPTCFPCQNATDFERTEMLNETGYQRTSWFEHTVWRIQVSTKKPYYPPAPSPKLNQWKLNQIRAKFYATVIYCENQVWPPEVDKRVYFAFLIIPVAVVGGVIYIKCRNKKTKEGYIDIEKNQMAIIN